jgi:cystathionine beta-lyase/cystathionine gamma-synthase
MTRIAELEEAAAALQAEAEAAARHGAVKQALRPGRPAVLPSRLFKPSYVLAGK